MIDRLKVPNFTSEAEEAQWWFDHREELTKDFEDASSHGGCILALLQEWLGNVLMFIKKAKTKTLTVEQVKKRKLTKTELNNLQRLAGLPDEKIDTSDIPEVTDFTGWKRGVLFRGTIRATFP